MENEESQNDPIKNIPILSINAGPKDGNWQDRQKEEYIALFEYMKKLKKDNNE